MPQSSDKTCKYIVSIDSKGLTVFAESQQSAQFVNLVSFLTGKEYLIK